MSSTALLRAYFNCVTLSLHDAVSGVFVAIQASRHAPVTLTVVCQWRASPFVASLLHSKRRGRAARCLTVPCRLKYNIHQNATLIKATTESRSWIGNGKRRPLIPNPDLAMLDGVDSAMLLLQEQSSIMSRAITVAAGPEPHDVVDHGRTDFLTMVVASCRVRRDIRSYCREYADLVARLEQPRPQYPRPSSVHTAMLVFLY